MMQQIDQLLKLPSKKEQSRFLRRPIQERAGAVGRCIHRTLASVLLVSSLVANQVKMIWCAVF